MRKNLIILVKWSGFAPGLIKNYFIIIIIM